MFCPSCGKQVPDGTGFCPNCGTKLASRQPKPGHSVGAPASEQNPRRKRGAKKPRLIPVIALAAIVLVAVALVIVFNPFGAKEGGPVSERTPEESVETLQNQDSSSTESEEPEQDAPDIHTPTAWDPETGSISNEYVSLTGLEWEMVDESSIPSDIAEEHVALSVTVGNTYRLTCTAENLTNKSSDTAIIISGSEPVEDAFGQKQVKPFSARSDQERRAGTISLAPYEKREATFFIVMPYDADESTFQPSALETKTEALDYSTYLPLDDPSLTIGDNGGAYELIRNGSVGSSLGVAADLTFTNTTDSNLSRVIVSYHYAYDGVVTPEVFMWEWVNLAPGETVSSRHDLLNKVDGGAEETKSVSGSSDIHDAEGLVDHLEVVPFQIEYEEAA